MSITSYHHPPLNSRLLLAVTASNQCLPLSSSPVEKSQTGKKPETQFGVNLVSAQCELRDKCLKSNPSTSSQVCLQSHFFSVAELSIKWNTLIIDSRAEAKQTFQHFGRRCPKSRHKITFSNYAPSVFFSAIRALYLFLSAQVTNKHQTEKLSFLCLNFPEFTTFWAEVEREVGIHAKQFWSHKPWFRASSGRPTEF